MSRRQIALAALAAAVAVAVVVGALPGGGGDDSADSSADGSADDPADDRGRAAATGPALTGPVDRYVALGDSFTAGPLIPYVDATQPTCLRSSANYPAVLGAWVDAGRVVDVSCTAADTGDLNDRGDGSGAAPPQLRAVTAGTDLVTLGTGGNDFGVFGSLVTRCPALAAADPDGAPCRESFAGGDGSDRLLGRMPAVERRLVVALDEVARRAPHAVVAAVGYPRIVPAAGSCAALPFAAGDYAWADRVERALNAALSRAARTTGAVYVDTYAASRGHDACAGAQAWVNGRDSRATRALAYHPYATGMVGAASAAYTSLTGAQPGPRRLREAARLTRERPAGTLSLREQRIMAALVAGG